MCISSVQPIPYPLQDKIQSSKILGPTVSDMIVLRVISNTTLLTLLSSRVTVKFRKKTFLNYVQVKTKTLTVPVELKFSHLFMFV